MLAPARFTIGSWVRMTWRWDIETSYWACAAVAFPLVIYSSRAAPKSISPISMDLKQSRAVTESPARAQIGTVPSQLA